MFVPLPWGRSQPRQWVYLDLCQLSHWHKSKRSRGSNGDKIYHLIIFPITHPSLLPITSPPQTLLPRLAHTCSGTCFTWIFLLVSLLCCHNMLYRTFATLHDSAAGPSPAQEETRIVPLFSMPSSVSSMDKYCLFFLGFAKYTPLYFYRENIFDF